MESACSRSSTESAILISVITACLNADRTIESTLRSVAKQEVVPGTMEHIVVDGASEDGTLEIVKQYPSINWTSEPDEGISDAFNKGLHLAKGTYVLYLNADDYLYDQMVLNDISNFIRLRKEPDWIVGDVVGSKSEDSELNQRRYPPSCWSLMFRNRIGHQSVFLKREILLEVGGFDVRYKTSMDYDLFERLCNRGKRPVYVPRTISVFSEEGLTSVTTPALINETQEVAGRFRNNLLKRMAGYAYDQLLGGK